MAPRRDGERDGANAAAALGAPALGPWRGGQEELEAAWTAAAAAAAATRGGGPRAKRRGWAAGGELPTGLYSCGGQHGQFHGSDQEPGAVAVPLFRAESAPGAEASLASEQLGHLQRRQSRRVSVDAKLAAPHLFPFQSIARLPGPLMPSRKRELFIECFFVDLASCTLICKALHQIADLYPPVYIYIYVFSCLKYLELKAILLEVP